MTFFFTFNDGTELLPIQPLRDALQVNTNCHKLFTCSICITGWYQQWTLSFQWLWECFLINSAYSFGNHGYKKCSNDWDNSDWYCCGSCSFPHCHNCCCICSHDYNVRTKEMETKRVKREVVIKGTINKCTCMITNMYML